jgi:tetratricopeptide (TPR) repeat protein
MTSCSTRPARLRRRTRPHRSNSIGRRWRSTRSTSAYTNLGRLLHARKQYDDAEAVYRHGLAHCGRDATLLFNLAIVLEDAHRSADAADMYREALKESPDLPEAHYNLALLCEAAGLKQEAIRHLSAYRKLSKR